MVQEGLFHGNLGYFTTVATALLVILGSFLYQHVLSYDNVFPAITNLFKTKIGIMGVYTATLISTFLITLLLSKIILGRLTLLEIYVIHDNLLETCIEVLMITAMFRNIASEKFFLPLVHMIAIKYFHWMLKERMDRLPVVSFSYCLRILVLANILFVNDIKLAHYFSDRSLDASFVQFIFFEQYSILITYVIQNVAKFILNFINNIKSEPMIFKSTIATFIDLIIYICRSIIYLVFCMFFAMEQTMPLFIIIPLIKTIIHGIQHSYTLVKTYYIFSEINKSAEVEALNDKTCIVCREDMTEARKLPCQHAFHSDCLMLWVQNGSNCPTCRKDIISPTNSSENNAAPNGDNRADNNVNLNAHPAPNPVNDSSRTPNNEPAPGPSTQSDPTQESTSTVEDKIPVNLKNLIPIYQGIPQRLMNFIVNEENIDIFSTFKLNDVRLLLKETDSLLTGGVYFSADAVNGNGTEDSVNDNKNLKREKFQKALQNLSQAQTIIQDELNKIS